MCAVRKTEVGYLYLTFAFRITVSDDILLHLVSIISSSGHLLVEESDLLW